MLWWRINGEDMYRKKTYLDKLLELREEYAELENWVGKERERVVKKIQREERRLIPLDLVTRKEAAIILGCSTRTLDRIIKGQYLERYYPQYAHNVKYGVLYFRREEIEKLKYRTKNLRLPKDLACWL